VGGGVEMISTVVISIASCIVGAGLGTGFFYLFVSPKYKKELNVAKKELQNIEIKLEEEKEINQDLQNKFNEAIKELQNIENIEIKLEEEKEINQDLQNKFNEAIKELEDLSKESQGKTLEKLKNIIDKLYKLTEKSVDVAKILEILIPIGKKILIITKDIFKKK
jgi:cysteinyl-tRNA synthetase